MSYTAVFVQHNDGEDRVILKPGETYSEADLYECGIQVKVFETNEECEAYFASFDDEDYLLHAIAEATDEELGFEMKSRTK